MPFTTQLWVHIFSASVDVPHWQTEHVSCDDINVLQAIPARFLLTFLVRQPPVLPSLPVPFEQVVIAVWYQSKTISGPKNVTYDAQLCPNIVQSLSAPSAQATHQNATSVKPHSVLTPHSVLELLFYLITRLI
jgi:hypothetical protein